MTPPKAAFPDPEPGLVISYSYLWRREQERGREEGQKNRPCVIILSVEILEWGKQITVAPITHSAPLEGAIAIEMPLKVKRHLGLDEARSWVILDEVNQFIWPGYDLRPIGGDKRKFAYGFLPPRLFDEIKNGILNVLLIGRGKVTLRD